MGRFGVAVALVLSCSACQVTIATDVQARVDGSGVIRAGVGLDPEALAQVPQLAEQLKVDDLRRAGWRVVGPRSERDGLTWIRASFAFATPSEAHRAVVQLNGPTGPFRGFALTHEASRFRSRVRFTGTVDLRDRARGVRRRRARAPPRRGQPGCRHGDVEATLRRRSRAAAEGAGDGAATRSRAIVAAARRWPARAAGRVVRVVGRACPRFDRRRGPRPGPRGPHPPRAAAPRPAGAGGHELSPAGAGGHEPSPAGAGGHELSPAGAGGHELSPAVTPGWGVRVECHRPRVGSGA